MVARQGFGIGVAFCLALWALPAAALQGRVLDARTGQPIAGAIVTIGSREWYADAAGSFDTGAEGAAPTIRVRAAGHARIDVALPSPPTEPLDIRLEPVAPKALYLSIFGTASAVLRESALRLVEETEINALVLDVKGDRGMLAFATDAPLAAEAGVGRSPVVKDMSALMRRLKQVGIYTIARVVVFKDDPLARARRDLAVRTAGGAVWHDREGLGWVDPFDPAVWRYNIRIAEEAAALGFDEIQFDYVRFPDAHGVVFSRPSTQETRTGAVVGFLRAAREALVPYNVFVAADVFGYTCWNLDDTQIGQKIESLAPVLDYISPMLYPSGFQFGIPGYRNPVAHAYEIVRLSLDRARERTGLPPVRFRPWLQAFKDYAFDRRIFDADEIRAQIRAAEAFGSNGWMLWNPRNVYGKEGLC
jgi:hypothetical protein